MLKKPFYITTTLPYVNAEPHIGFALEIVQADAIARHRSLMGYDVFFNMGTDEHGQKIYIKALEANKTPKEYCDEYASKFDNLKSKLNLSYNNFIRTTDDHHIKSAQEFWNRCLANGDIYKKTYQTKYCVGCELEKTDSELVDGRCPWHPDKELELREEENYFFRFSKYQQSLIDLYDNVPNFVLPSKRLTEIRSFVSGGLQDFSISRLKSKMPWGIEVPNDSEHLMYVWFDALINYISAIGWPDDAEKFNKYWPVIQVAGKDNLRQQAAMWQAMLLSAGISNSKQVFIHGFLTTNGQKISKSLGNVVDPFELVDKFGTDALRYYILRGFNPTEDSDYTDEKFREKYNAELVNGLGNLVSRVIKMVDFDLSVINIPSYESLVDKAFDDLYSEFKFNEISEKLYDMVRKCNEYVNDKTPWKLDGENKRLVVTEMLNKLVELSVLYEPLIPESSHKIISIIKGEMRLEEVLFKRVV